MSKPIVSKIDSYDATKNYTVTFSYTDSMITGHKVYVYDASDPSTRVYYNHVKNSPELTHVIPAKSLVNGKKYYIKVVVYDINGDVSSSSNKIYFYCLKTPTFHFKNVTSGDNISSASLYAKIKYSQDQGEELAQIIYYLYEGDDKIQTLLSASETYYGEQYLSYKYTRLINDKIYFIRAVASTQHGFQLDTGLIRVNVNYQNHDEYGLVFADCDKKDSTVHYHTRFIIIDPSKDINYDLSESGYLKLSSAQKSISYDQNFNLSGDFTITLRGKNLMRTNTILTCTNADGETITLRSQRYSSKTLRYFVKVPGAMSNYYIFSDLLKFTASDLVTVTVRRINNVYSLTTFITTVTRTEDEDEYIVNEWEKEEYTTVLSEDGTESITYSSELDEIEVQTGGE